MPRRSSEVWIHYHNENHEGKEVFVCKYCSCVYRFPNATKMSKHLMKCKKCPFDIDVYRMVEVNHDTDISDDLAQLETVNECTDAVDNAGTSGGIPKEQQNVKRTTVDIQGKGKAHGSKIMKKDEEEDKFKHVDSLFARAVFTSGCSFSDFQTSYWKAFCHTLNNSYKIPNKRRLQFELLYNEHKTIAEHVKESLRTCPKLVLLESGWSDLDNMAVSLVALAPDPVYIRSDLIDKAVKTSSSGLDLAIASQVNSIGNKKVFVLIGDCVGKAIDNMTQHLPHTIVISCAAHCLDSYLKVIFEVEPFTEICVKVREVLSLLSSDDVFALLRKNISEAHILVDVNLLILSDDHKLVDFATAVSVLASLKESIQKTVVGSKFKQLRICDTDTEAMILDNRAFWLKVDQMVEVVKPVFMFIRNLEGSKYSLSDVLDVFYQLRQQLENPVKLNEQQSQHLLSELTQIESSLLRPIHAAAYLLDPRFKDGEASSDETESCGLDCITSLAEQLNLNVGQVLTNFAQFRSASGPWANKSVWSCAPMIEPSVWWKGLFGKQALSPLATLLLSIPPTVVMARECQAIYKSSSRRNLDLSSDQVSKLVDIQCNLTLSSKAVPSANATNLTEVFVNDDSD